MIKRTLKKILLTLSLVCVCMLTGCTSFSTWLEQQRCVHTWNEGERTVVATCTVFGETTYTCTKCGKTKTQQNEKLPHKEYTIAQQDATCTDTGLTEYVICTVCQGNITQPKEIPALGHAIEKHAHIDATCLTSGQTEGQFCNRCDEWIIEPTKIPATGHDLDTVEIPPTCTTEGKTGGTVCKNCDTVYAEPKKIPATGHNVVDGACTWCGEILDAEAFFWNKDESKATEVTKSHVTTSGFYRIYVDLTYDGSISLDFKARTVSGVNYSSAYGNYAFRHVSGVGVVDTSIEFGGAVIVASGEILLTMKTSPAIAFKYGEGFLDVYFYQNNYTAKNDSGSVLVEFIPDITKTLENSAVTRILKF